MELTQIEKPEWVFGDEERFYDFIEGLGKEKITLVSHTDLDGIASAKIVDTALRADNIHFVNYQDLNLGLAAKIREGGSKKVIFTDLFFKNRDVINELEKFADVLIIDHHTPETDFNSGKTVFMNAQGYCASYLAYSLFSQNDEIRNFDWLVACASVADFLFRKNEGFMRETMEKYGDKYEVNGEQIRTNGKVWDTQWKISLALVYHEKNPKKVFDSIGMGFGEMGELERNIIEVQKEYDFHIRQFDREKIQIDGGYYWQFSPHFKIGSIIANELSCRERDKTLVLVSPDGENYKLSSRRQDGEIDMNEYCKKLVAGMNGASAGGHRKATGGYFPKKYLKEFKKRLGILN